jgi:SAM-dependent methyltransferase
MASDKLAADIARFWHGQVEGKQQPFHLYTPEARGALRQEVERVIEQYARTNALSADRLMRYWELISIYISTQNEQAGGEGTAPASFHLSQFLHLLYAEKTPSAFWRAFARRNHLRKLPRQAFWDYFEEFQPKRLEVVDWLQKNAKGKILDLGAGAHSYIPVEVAVDGSEKALIQNRWAKRRAVADLDATGPWPSALGLASFDTILLNSILAYVRSPANILRQCKRFIEPKGRLLITNAPVQAHHPASVFVRREVDVRALKKWLGDAGWQVKADDSIGPLVRLVAAPGAQRPGRANRP